jgi:hypothetical protein
LSSKSSQVSSPNDLITASCNNVKTIPFIFYISLSNQTIDVFASPP